MTDQVIPDRAAVSSEDRGRAVPDGSARRRRREPKRSRAAASNGYDGFVSYSHAADAQLATELQRGLQRFAKPWYRMRALRVFRDEVSLSANPGLWSSIQQALDD